MITDTAAPPPIQRISTTVPSQAGWLDPCGDAAVTSLRHFTEGDPSRADGWDTWLDDGMPISVAYYMYIDRKPEIRASATWTTSHDRIVWRAVPVPPIGHEETGPLGKPELLICLAEMTSRLEPPARAAQALWLWAAEHMASNPEALAEWTRTQRPTLTPVTSQQLLELADSPDGRVLLVYDENGRLRAGVHVPAHADMLSAISAAE